MSVLGACISWWVYLMYVLADECTWCMRIWWCYYHIRSPPHSSVSEDVSKMIACSMVGCRLDYANSVFLGTSAKVVHRLEHIQNTLAIVVTRQHGRTSISATLQKLHWLPVKWRINFKVTTLTYKVLESGEPSYLSSKIAIAVPSRSLRSSADTRRLAVFPHKLNIGARAFWHAAPSIWNCLPFNVHTAPTVLTFKSRLKTFYFQQAFQ